MRHEDSSCPLPNITGCVTGLLIAFDPEGCPWPMLNPVTLWCQTHHQTGSCYVTLDNSRSMLLGGTHSAVGTLCHLSLTGDHDLSSTEEAGQTQFFGFLPESIIPSSDAASQSSPYGKGTPPGKGCCLSLCLSHLFCWQPVTRWR